MLCLSVSLLIDWCLHSSLYHCIMFYRLTTSITGLFIKASNNWTSCYVNSGWIQIEQNTCFMRNHSFANSVTITEDWVSHKCKCKCKCYIGYIIEWLYISIIISYRIKCNKQCCNFKFWMFLSVLLGIQCLTVVVWLVTCWTCVGFQIPTAVYHISVSFNWRFISDYYNKKLKFCRFSFYIPQAHQSKVDCLL